MIIVVNYNKLIERYVSYTKKGNTGRKSLVGLGERLSGKCPLCDGPITEGGKLIVCPSCLTVYHLNCIEEMMSYNNTPDSTFTCIICGYKIPLASIKSLQEVQFDGRK